VSRDVAPSPRGDLARHDVRILIRWLLRFEQTCSHSLDCSRLMIGFMLRLYATMRHSHDDTQTRLVRARKMLVARVMLLLGGNVTF